MVSSKGWLTQGSPDTPRRVTAGQKDMVVRTVNAAVDRAVAGTSSGNPFVAMLEAARLAVIASLEEYPEDRSCATCDHYVGATCQHHKAEVPADFIDRGCEYHQTDGTPF